MAAACQRKASSSDFFWFQPACPHEGFLVPPSAPAIGAASTYSVLPNPARGGSGIVVYKRGPAGMHCSEVQVYSLARLGVPSTTEINKC